MPDFTYEQLVTGDGPLSPDSQFGQLVGAARDFVCDIYRAYPKFALADPLGAGAISEAIWDQICRQDPGDNFPVLQPGIPGGQCPGSNYRITYRAEVNGSAEVINITRKGPVGSINTKAVGPGLIDVFFATGDGPYNIFSNASLEAWQNGTIAAQIILVQPEPGQPDNCGNGLPVHPPVIPPADELERDAPISPRGGPSFTIPLVYIRPTVDIDNEFDVDLTIPVTIRGPLIGIDIQFGPNGINITPGPRDNPWRQPGDPRAPNVPPGSKSPELRELEKLTKDQKELLDRLKKLAICVCPEDGIVRAITAPAGPSGRISAPQRTFLVVTQITTFPVNGKTQYGEGQSDVYYAGWGWWTQGGGMGDRMPLDAAEKAFTVRAGPKPSAFEYTCTNGYRASATLYYTTDT